MQQKPEPVKVETKIETRTTKFVVISGKWIFKVEESATVVKQ